MKISIITPVCESRVVIDECIQSISNQSYPDIEFVVVDYGPPDGTRKAVSSMISDARYFEVTDDARLKTAINHGIRMARGDVICLLNPEDQVTENETIQKVVDAFNATKANLVYGKGMTRSGRDILHTLRTFGSKPHHKKYMPFGKIPLHTSIYIKRELLDVLGFSNPQYKVGSEYELYLRLFMDPSIDPHFMDEFIVKICLKEEVENTGSSKKNKLKVSSKKLQPAFLKR